MRSVELRGEEDETLEVEIGEEEEVEILHCSSTSCPTCPSSARCTSCPPACADPSCTACAQAILQYFFKETVQFAKRDNFEHRWIVCPGVYSCWSPNASKPPPSWSKPHIKGSSEVPTRSCFAAAWMRKPDRPPFCFCMTIVFFVSVGSRSCSFQNPILLFFGSDVIKTTLEYALM